MANSIDSILNNSIYASLLIVVQAVIEVVYE